LGVIEKLGVFAEECSYSDTVRGYRVMNAEELRGKCFLRVSAAERLKAPQVLYSVQLV
jgi:hypothetical protein